MPVIIYDIIPSNFTYDNLMHTLNYHGGKVTNEQYTAFIITANVNKWSRFKPFRFNKFGHLTEAEIRSINFGLIMPEGSDDPVVAISRTYEYDAPRRGELMRITDFRGYNPTVPAPCIGFGDVTVDMVMSTTFTLTFMYGFGGEYSIGLRDLNTLSDKYLAVCFTYKDSGVERMVYKTQPLPLQQSVGSFTFDLKTDPPFNVSTASDIKYYFLAARDMKLNIADNFYNIFYALPFDQDNPGYGNVIKKETIGLDMVFTHISREAEGIDYSINLYTGIELPGSQSIRFKIEPNGDFFISGTATNNTSSPITLYPDNMTIEASSTFGTVQPLSRGVMSVGTGAIKPSIGIKQGGRWRYWGSSSITIQAGETIEIKIGESGLFSYVNGVITSFNRGLQKSAYLEVDYNNKFIGGTVMIRLQS